MRPPARVRSASPTDRSDAAGGPRFRRLATLLLCGILGSNLIAGPDGRLIFIGWTQDRAHSVWLSVVPVGDYELNSINLHTTVDTWSQARPGLHLSASPDQKNNGGPHTLYVWEGNKERLVDIDTQHPGGPELPNTLPPIPRPPPEVITPEVPVQRPENPDTITPEVPVVVPPRPENPDTITPEVPTLRPENPDTITPELPVQRPEDPDTITPEVPVQRPENPDTITPEVPVQRPENPDTITPELPVQRPENPDTITPELPVQRPENPDTITPEVPVQRPENPDTITPELPVQRPENPDTITPEIPIHRPENPDTITPELPVQRPENPDTITPELPVQRPENPDTITPEVPVQRPENPDTITPELPVERPENPDTITPEVPVQRPENPDTITPELPVQRPENPDTITPELPVQRPENPDTITPELPVQRPENPNTITPEVPVQRPENPDTITPEIPVTPPDRPTDPDPITPERPVVRPNLSRPMEPTPPTDLPPEPIYIDRNVVASRDGHGWNVWTDLAHYDYTDRRGDADTDARTTLATFGADTGFESGLTLGLVVGRAQAHTDFFDHQLRIRSHSTNGGLYFGWPFADRWMVDGSLNATQAHSRLELLGLSGRYNQDVLDGSLGLSARFASGAWLFIPRAAMTYSVIDTDAYVLSGDLAGRPLAVDLAGTTRRGGQSSLSLEISRVMFTAGDTPVMPFMHLELSYDFERLTGIDGVSSDLSREISSRWTGAAKLGLRAYLTPQTNLTLTGGYDSLGHPGLDIAEVRLTLSHSF